MADCPVCDAAIPKKSGFKEGEILECEECGSELEVTSLEPLTLEEAPFEEGDDET